MKKRTFICLLTFVLALTIAAPALAGDKVSLNVNGDNVISSALYQENGVSFVPLETFVRFAGADVKWITDQEFQIIENDTVLSMTIGQNTALLAEKPVIMPAAPRRDAIEGVFIPLRFVAGAFGFEVGWDQSKQLVSLNRNETRDGMTPMDLLSKSNQTALEINTYSMAGDINMTIDLQETGKETDSARLKMKTRMEGQMQSKPMQAYLKMSITSDSGLIPETNMETYMTEEKMYVKTADQEWTVQDMPFSPEFWRQQQDIQSDPLKAVVQMKEMGLLLNYGNDTVIDGVEYYVLNASIDMNKFRREFNKMAGQMMQTMPLSMGAAGSEELQVQMNKIMEKTSMDYYYTVYLNKGTLISEIIRINVLINMTIDPAEFMDPGAGPEEGEGAAADKGASEEINMSMTMEGDLYITDTGKPFIVPDVSKASAAAPTATPPAPAAD